MHVLWFCSVQIRGAQLAEHLLSEHLKTKHFLNAGKYCMRLDNRWLCSWSIEWSKAAPAVYLTACDCTFTIDLKPMALLVLDLMALLSLRLIEYPVALLRVNFTILGVYGNFNILYSQWNLPSIAVLLTCSDNWIQMQIIVSEKWNYVPKMCTYCIPLPHGVQMMSVQCTYMYVNVYQINRLVALTID